MMSFERPTSAIQKNSCCHETSVLVTKAKSDYWKNIDYIIEQWDLRVAHNFIDKTNRTINLIQDNPQAFPISDYKNVCRAVIVPQVALFYRINLDETIDLLRFWSNFQDPDALKF